MVSRILESNTWLILDHKLLKNEEGFFVKVRFNGYEESSGVFASRDKAKKFLCLCIEHEVLPLNIKGVYDDLVFIDNYLN